MKLVNLLYKITRKTGRAASQLNDIENIANGRVDRVVKKKLKRKMHQELNKMTKKL